MYNISTTNKFNKDVKKAEKRGLNIELFKKFEEIQDMGGETKNLIVRFLNLAIRDYKAKQAYAG